MSGDLSTWLDDYTDKELISYLGLNEEFTLTELAKKMNEIKSMISTSDQPNVVEMLELYDKMEERLEPLVTESESEDEEPPPGAVPAMPSKINKSHTLLINSDKRADRRQSTSSFSWELQEEIANVKKLYIESYTIPKSWYNISSEIGNNIFGISYFQPIKIYFTAESDVKTKFNEKSPIHGTINNFNSEQAFDSAVFDTSFSNWINQNIVLDDIGAGLIRESNGKPKTDFPARWTDVSWNVTAISNVTAYETYGDLSASLLHACRSTNNIIFLKDVSFNFSNFDISNVIGFQNHTDISNTFVSVSQQTADSDTNDDYDLSKIFLRKFIDVKRYVDGAETFDSYHDLSTYGYDDTHFIGKDISSADSLTDLANNDGSVITISNDSHNFKRYIRIGDAMFDNWESTEKIYTADSDQSFNMIEESMLLQNDSDVVKDWVLWGDISFQNFKPDISLSITNDESAETADISLGIKLLNMGEGATYHYVIIRDTLNNDPNHRITDSNVTELSDNNIFFLIKREVNMHAGGSFITGQEVADFLNRRKPIDFSGINTDARAAAHFETQNTYNYGQLLKHFNNVHDQYIPPNTKKRSDYDLWSSFKNVNFNDSDDLNITTNMEIEQVKEVMKDISNIGWNVSTTGISENFTFSRKEGATFDLISGVENFLIYNFDAAYSETDPNTIILTLTPKETCPRDKKLERQVYFRLKDGHYGTSSKLLSAINAITPKKYYDDFLSGNTSGVNDMLDYVVDAPVDITNPTFKSHQLFRDAYNNEFGTSFLNTIDWTFTKESEGKIELTNLTADVSFIFYDDRLADIFRGTLSCHGSRDVSSKRDALFKRRNTLGRMMGYFDDSLDSEDVYIRSIANTLLERSAPNSPDLRRIKNIKIMLIDYKSYAYTANADQSDPAPSVKSLKTPWYYNEVVFESECVTTFQILDGDIIYINTTIDASNIIKNDIPYNNIVWDSVYSPQTNQKSIDISYIANIVDITDISLVAVYPSVYPDQFRFDNIIDDNATFDIQNKTPIFTAGNSRQLTEKQIYSLNAVFDSQTAAAGISSNEKVLNYTYRDYFLYGIGLNDQPEPGNSANDKVLAKFESKKGVRTYNEPTRLTKLHIEIVDQDYNLIDFNGIDIELVLNIDTEVSVTK